MKYKVTWTEQTKQMWSSTIVADSVEEAIDCVEKFDEGLQENIELISSDLLGGLENIIAEPIKEEK